MFVRIWGSTINWECRVERGGGGRRGYNGGACMAGVEWFHFPVLVEENIPSKIGAGEERRMVLTE